MQATGQAPEARPVSSRTMVCLQEDTVPPRPALRCRPFAAQIHWPPFHPPPTHMEPPDRGTPTFSNHLPLMTPDTRFPRLPAGPITSLAAVVLCIGALILLVPGRGEAIPPFMPNGKTGTGLAAGSDCADQSAMITALTAKSLRLCRDHHWSQESVGVLNNFLRTTDNLEPIASEILSQSSSIPRAPRISILGTLAQRALERGDAALAETLELHLLKAVQTLTSDLLRQVVTTSRSDNDPALRA